MKKTALAFTLVLTFSIIFGVQFVKFVEANPMEGPYSPTEPIRDPPTIIIDSPTNVTYSQNIIPLRIKVIQPDSWVTNQSDPNVWVVGPNSLRLVSCELDGESFVLWNGTWASIGSGNSHVCYYLPKDSEFSAMMNVSSGQHALEVSIKAIADYYSPPNFPFPREYNIATSENLVFFVQTGSDVVWLPSIESVETPNVPFPPDYFNYEGQFWLVPLVVILATIAIGSGLGLIIYSVKRRKSKFQKATITQ